MGWLGAGWLSRKTITVDKDKVPSTLSDFPVYVDLSDLDSHFFSNVKADGGDIRITQANGTTEQAVGIDFINTGLNTGELHFKASSLSSVSDTIFYIYYNNSGASLPAPSDPYGSQNVWDNDYKLRWSCQEDPSGGSGAVKDSTSNANNGTGAAGMTSGDLVTGKLAGNAYDFDGGATDYIDSNANLWSNADFNTGASMSIWINGVTAGLSQPADIEGWYVIQSNSSKYAGTTDGATIRTQVSAPAAGWHLITLDHTNNGGTSSLYIDDEAVVSGSTGTTNVDSTSRAFRLGGWAGGAGFRFIGQIDEVRISIGGVRGQDWHDTTFNNQGSPSTFYTIGATESIEKTLLIIWR